MHETLRLFPFMSRAYQSFIGAQCTLASNREMLVEQIWRLTKGWVDGIGTFHKMTEPRQVGLDLACGGGTAQGSLSLKQEAVVATKQNCWVSQLGHTQHPDKHLC